MNSWTVRNMCLFSGSRRSKLPYSSVLILVWLLGRVSVVLALAFLAHTLRTYCCPPLPPHTHTYTRTHARTHTCKKPGNTHATTHQLTWRKYTCLTSYGFFKSLNLTTTETYLHHDHVVTTIDERYQVLSAARRDWQQMSEDRWVDDGGQIHYNIYYACAGRKRSRQERKFTSRNRLSVVRFVNTFFQQSTQF